MSVKYDSARPSPVLAVMSRLGADGAMVAGRTMNLSKFFVRQRARRVGGCIPTLRQTPGVELGRRPVASWVDEDLTSKAANDRGRHSRRGAGDKPEALENFCDHLRLFDGGTCKSHRPDSSGSWCF